MAFFWGRFDPIETVDSEVTELYRIRDKDEKYKNNKALLVNTSSLNNYVIDDYKIAGDRATRKPTDPIWLSMTEEERVENGFPTRLSMFQNSMFGFTAFLIWGGNIFIYKIIFSCRNSSIFSCILPWRNNPQKSKKRKNI